MKKKLLFVSCFMLSLLAFTNRMSAQAWNGSRDSKLQLGLSAWGHGTGIMLTYDHGVADFVSLGLGGDFYFDNHHHHHDHDNTTFYFYGRVNIHLNPLLRLPKALDIYPGVKLGIYDGDFAVGAHIGVRYMFNPRIGVFGEFGNLGGLGVVFNL